MSSDSSRSLPPAAGEAAHTPTLWTRDGERILLNGRIVAVSKDKADTIVRACNSHEALVAALDSSNLSLAIQRDAAIERGDARTARLIGECITSNLTALAAAKEGQR